MVRRDLPQELRKAGADLLAITDALSMNAQAAMWVYDHALQEWRYYLVTSLIETEGRRRIYEILLEAFSKIQLPGGMVIDDINLGSVDDPLFRVMSSNFHIGGKGIIDVTNSLVDDFLFSGVIYRSLPVGPTPKTRLTAKKFAKAVRELQMQ